MDQDQEVSLANADDQIAETWREIIGRGEADDAPAEDAEKPQRVRDESGKFARTEKVEKVNADAKIGGEVPAQDAPESAPPVAAETAPVAGTLDPNDRPPSSWKPAAREQWAKLPPDIRAEIQRRETESHQGFQQIKPDVEMGRAMRQVIEPFRAMIEAEGSTPDRAVAGLFRTAALLRTGSPEMKAAEVAKIISGYGIPLDRLNAYLTGEAQPQTAPQPQEFRDPRFDAYLQQQQQREMQENENVVNQWLNEVDAQGQPLRKFYNDVAAEMQTLLPAIREQKPGLSKTQILQEAYDRAVWANPDTRALVQSELEAKRREENLRKANEAKKAASVNVPRRGHVPSAAPKGSMDDTIRNAARELGFFS